VSVGRDLPLLKINPVSSIKRARRSYNERPNGHPLQSSAAAHFITLEHHDKDGSGNGPLQPRSERAAVVILGLDNLIDSSASVKYSVLRITTKSSGKVADVLCRGTVVILVPAGISI
jgi:hypothetical protein